MAHLRSRASSMILMASDVANAQTPKSRYNALVELRKFLDDQNAMDIYLSLVQEIQIAEQELNQV